MSRSRHIDCSRQLQYQRTLKHVVIGIRDLSIHRHTTSDDAYVNLVKQKDEQFK